MNRIKLGLVCDLFEENWASMDLVADQLFSNLQVNHADSADPEMIRSRVRAGFSRFAGRHEARFLRNVDRMLTRMWYFPRYVRQFSETFDVFHICDHSYAHIIHELPALRTGVFCHDLDAFQCVLEPEVHRRPWFLRYVAYRVLGGLRKASIVFHSTRFVRDEVLRYRLLEPEKLVHAPYGVSPEFSAASSEADLRLCEALGLRARGFILHVGSCIRRKRIDVLLDVFASVRARHPDLLLVQIGGEWTTEQRTRLTALGVNDYVIQPGRKTQHDVAKLYRTAALVLMPSDAEGFGLPVIEALACGAIVVASDIPALREVGDEAAVYCGPGDVEHWVETVCRLLETPGEAPNWQRRVSRAGCFSWQEHTKRIIEAYRERITVNK